MLWLNIDRPTGAWKIHKSTCRYCNPVETYYKGLNEMKEHGGWFEVESIEEAQNRFNKEHKHNEYRRPCKLCFTELD